MSIIPKTIHQIWIGPDKAPKELGSWKEKHPEFDYILWDEAKIKEKFPTGLICQNQYDSIPSYAAQAVILRYEIIYAFGGFYADADMLCLRQLDNYLLDDDSFACYVNEWRRGRLISINCIGACQGNGLMKLLIDQISGFDYDEDSDLLNSPIASSIGSIFFTKTILENQYPLSMYPSWFFYPKQESGYVYQGLGESYATLGHL